jgi:two-component system, chemotaxis family, sensor kinase CheA
MERDAEFQKHLLETFKLEAEEHLKGITSALIEMERGTPEQQAELVEPVFREAHSLKGAARSVGRGDIESLCQAMEGVFSAMKRGEVQLSAELFDLLQRSADFLDRLLYPEGEPAEEEKSYQRDLVKKCNAAAKGEAFQPPPPLARVAAAEPGKGERAGATAAPSPGAIPAAEEVMAAATAPADATSHRGETVEITAATPAAPKTSAASDKGAHHETRAPAAESIRVSWSKLSNVLLLSEEMLSAKLSARQRSLQMREVRASFHAWRKEWNRVTAEVQKVSPMARRVAPGAAERPGHGKELARIVDFLEWNSAFMKSLETRYAAQAKQAEHHSRSLGGMVDNLLAEMKKAMMFPFSSLLEAFPKIVRDLARDSGKEVELVIRGEEIEIDRRILEEMKDPLIHLVRNSVDHGIEKPEERESKHKPRRGTITINIAPRDDKAEIVIADDGAGISPALVRGALLRLGTLTPERSQSLSDADLLPFIFQSGVSTSPIITEVSGHGLGLAIVREKVERLGGTVSLESDPGRGATFRIVLPMSVATFRGILVQVADRVFVLPATHVERAVRLRKEVIKTVENRETVTLGETVVSLERLAAVLELPAQPATPEQLQAVVVTAGEQTVAFLVDEVLGEQEVLMKGLGPQLSRVRNVAGATVLGSGRVAPILNVPDLMKSATRLVTAEPTAQTPLVTAGAPRQKLLVADDSITSRTLLKNILESAGYLVSTAVDGVDALTQLRSGQFDAVVSDVDMPRMNGFDLTARVRSDPKLAEIPVVLVTGLENREDRERGIDVGANAYIVKSSFDQSNLLEVVKRLV